MTIPSDYSWRNHAARTPATTNEPGCRTDAAAGGDAMAMERVATKQQFYREFYKGSFGNHGPMWRTFDEYWQSGYSEPIAIRTLGIGTRCDYFIPRDAVADRMQSFLADGWKVDQLNFSAQIPEEDKLIQGEVMQTFEGLSLLYSRSLLPMRQALATEPQRAAGLKARFLLQSAMDAASFDWLFELFDRYPGHAVEFTTLRYPWGVIPGMNTVFWEVRDY